MRRAVGVLCVVLLCTAALAGSAAAADTPGLFDFDPQETDAEPGETVEVDVTLQAISTYGDEAVASMTYTIAYDPDVLAVQDVEEGPWLYMGEQETDVTFRSEVDNEAGQVTIEQAREPPAGGAVGTNTTATLTFEVREDAPPSDATLQFEDTEVQMLEYPLPTIEREGLIRIAGGDEQHTGVEDDAENDADGVTLAEDTPSPTESDPPEDDATGMTGDGFGPVTVLGAVLVLLTVLSIRRR